MLLNSYVSSLFFFLLFKGKPLKFFSFIFVQRCEYSIENDTHLLDQNFYLSFSTPQFYHFFLSALFLLCNSVQLILPVLY